jgi:hemerythrin
LPLLTWDGKHSVGVQALDGQHLELYETINDLHTAVLQGKERSQTSALLRQVAVSARAHFSSEEAMLASTNYPGLAAHKLKHQVLIAEIEELLTRFENGDLTLNNRSLNFLGYWFNAHTEHDDLPYGVWLNAHGVR